MRRRTPEPRDEARPRIDPLLPVRVLKLAESRAGIVTVSSVAMALNVGLDECQLALDELVRKGAANADVDLSTGVASYSFPEFLPQRSKAPVPCEWRAMPEPGGLIALEGAFLIERGLASGLELEALYCVRPAKPGRVVYSAEAPALSC